MAVRERFAKGLEGRRAVLGDKHVNRSLEKRNSFTEEFQDLVTRYAWGEMWTRPVLPRDTRSLITHAMLNLFNRGDAVRLHLRGAINNGGTRDQIMELFLQAAIYCGVPAANSAFHAAEEIFGEEERRA